MSPRIRVFPTVGFLDSDDIQKAARASLMGPKTRLLPSGWSYFDRKALAKLPITPVKVPTLKEAEKTGLAFLAKAQKSWQAAGQKTALFPLDTALFRMTRVEGRMIRSGKRSIGWRVTWIVFADVGSTAERVAGTKDGFTPVGGASITLIVSLTGRVVGGSATWRPTAAPMVKPQKQTPKALIAHLAKNMVKSTDDDHGATKAKPKTPQLPTVEMRYVLGARAEFNTFLDPRLLYIRPDAHHAPPLCVPVTDYGVSVDIISLALNSGRTGADGEVELHPWIVTADGSISTATLPKGYKAHWTIIDTGSDTNTAPSKVAGAGMLKLKGLGRAALTVTNPNGAIAHAHADVCSFVDVPKSKAMV